MIVPVILYGSPVLRKHSFELNEDDNLQQLSVNLMETLKMAGGIGLAAPQTGLLKRAFVIDTSPLAEDDILIQKYEQTFINPEITGQSFIKTYYNEGCLSLPGIFEDVLRPEKITVRYFDLNFNRVEEELDGIKARIFQHEIDHLEGILFIDKLNILKRKLLTGRLNKIAKSSKIIKK